MGQITVCICTYKRPLPLERLLNSLGDQDTHGLFTYSVVVVDNDELRSAEAVVTDAARTMPVEIKYCVEAKRGIAHARNKALENAHTDFIAFIDDDEFPTNQWLFHLFQTCEKYQVDGVLGPVRRHFDEEPPKWIRRGEFFNRPSHPTGFILHWSQTRTGNVLFRRHVLPLDSLVFRAEFRAGSDVDFFKRVMAKGYVFVWCDEAFVHETIPPARWTRKYILRKALLRGRGAALRRDGALVTIKSLIAVPVYTVALPVAFAWGHHRFMLLLMKICDHLGKILTLVGVNPIKDVYVTE
jgi:glycosyltransferase involved in cell wall biosynthesis